MKFSIEVINQKAIDRTLIKKGESITKQCLDGLNRCALLILTDAKDRLKSNSSIATGALRNSGRVKKEGNEIEVGFYMDYAKYVEFGRKAGQMPPLGTLTKGLYAWVLKKGIADTTTKSGKRRKRGEDFVQRAKSIAYAIAISIRNKGTKPKPYLYPVLRSYENKIIEIIKRSVRL